jgi:hypothetical protein
MRDRGTAWITLAGLWIACAPARVLQVFLLAASTSASAPLRPISSGGPPSVISPLIILPFAALARIQTASPPAASPDPQSRTLSRRLGV